MKYILILAIFISTKTFSGTGRTVGNGGDVLYCKDIKETLTVLDWYEGQELRNFHLSLGESTLSLEEKINLVLSRLVRLSPIRAQRYKEHVSAFFDDVKWIKDGTLVDIPDSDHVVIPTNCKILQIANQSTPVFKTDKRYLIDFSLWNNLDNNQKVALIFHEVIYREALELGHINSISTRLLNSLLLSLEIEQMSIEEFNNVLRKIDFKWGENQGIQFLLDESFFFENGQLKSGTFLSGSLLKFRNNSIQVTGNFSIFSNGQISLFTPLNETNIQIDDNKYNLLPFPVEIYENGHIKKMMLNPSTVFVSQSNKLEIQGAVSYYNNGELKSCHVKSGRINNRNYRKQDMEIMGNTSFYQNGVVKQTNFKNPERFRISNQLGDIDFYSTIWFSENGQILKGYVQNELKIYLQKKQVLVAQGTPITFWENDGGIRQFQTAHEVNLKNCYGNSRNYYSFETIELSQDGCVIDSN